MFCPQCGTSNPDTSSYCKKCGASLQQAAVTAQTLANMTPKTPSASFNKPFVVGISIALALGLGVSAYALATGRAGIGILGTPTSASVTDVDPGLAMVAKNFVGALYGRDIASMTPRELLEDAVIAEQCLPYLKPSPAVYDKFVETVVETYGSDPAGTMRVMTDEPTMEMTDDDALKVTVPYKLEPAPPVLEYVSGTETNPTEQPEGPAEPPVAVGDAQVQMPSDSEIQASIEKALEDWEKTEASLASSDHTSEPKTTSNKTGDKDVNKSDTNDVPPIYQDTWNVESEASKDDKQSDSKPEEPANSGKAEPTSSGNQSENAVPAAEPSIATEASNPTSESSNNSESTQQPTGDTPNTDESVDGSGGPGATQTNENDGSSDDKTQDSEGDESNNDGSQPSTGDASDTGPSGTDTPPEYIDEWIFPNPNNLPFEGVGHTGTTETQPESSGGDSASDGASRILFARKERNAISAFLR